MQTIQQSFEQHGHNCALLTLRESEVRGNVPRDSHRSFETPLSQTRWRRQTKTVPEADEASK